MQRFRAVQDQEITAIVRYKRVLLLDDQSHEAPVFHSAQTKVIHMVCCESSFVRELCERQVKTLVNEKLHLADVRCVRGSGLRFAHGRTAGRPRRGNDRT
jgi:hypothetical protein